MRKIIFIYILVILIFLINPVYGYINSDDSQDYTLTKYPDNYILHSGNSGYYLDSEDYSQYFYLITKEGNYIPNEDIYSFIITRASSYNKDEMNDIFENYKNKYSNSDNSNNYGYYEINEIYGIGDKSYKITHYNKDNQVDFKYLIFVNKHIMIRLINTNSNNDYSNLVKFANLYDNKINSILENQPQIFANIDLEDSVYYEGDSFTYTITLSEDSNILIENQINDKEWTIIQDRTFYKKGQYILYARIGFNNNIGNEKIKLIATSLKGSTAISTTSFVSKEKIKEKEFIVEEIPYETEKSIIEINEPVDNSIKGIPPINIFFVILSFLIIYYKEK